MIEEKKGSELLREALGNKAEAIKNIATQETITLLNEIDKEGIISIGKKLSEATIKVTDTKLKGLAEWVNSSSNGKISPKGDSNFIDGGFSNNASENNETPSESGVESTPQQPDQGTQQPEKSQTLTGQSIDNGKVTQPQQLSNTHEYLPLANKTLMEFDAGIEAVQSTKFMPYRISDQIRTKLSPEQLPHISAFDKIQASTYVMICNANTRNLPPEFLMKSSVVMTLQVFEHIGKGGASKFNTTKLSQSTEKLASNKLLGDSAKGITDNFNKLTSSFEKSGIMDMVGGVQALLGAPKAFTEITTTRNNYLSRISDGDLTGVDLTHASLPAIHSIYQSSKSGYPSTEQTQSLNIAGDDTGWIAANTSKLLTLSPVILDKVDANTKEIIDKIINPKNQKKLQEFVIKSEGIMDTMMSYAASMGISPEAFESILDSLGEWFKKFAFIGPMLGVDMTQLTSTLEGKLTSKEQQLLTTYLKSYQATQAQGSHPRDAYVTDDPNLTKQSIIRTINIKSIAGGLISLKPAGYVVDKVVGEDAGLRSIYFDYNDQGQLTISKDRSKISESDKIILIEKYLSNQEIITDLLSNVTGTTGEDMKIVGLAATGYMKGLRGQKFYDNYINDYKDDVKHGEKVAKATPDSAEQSTETITITEKIAPKPGWEQYYQTHLHQLPPTIKQEFALQRLGIPVGNTPSAFMIALQNIFTANELPQERIPDFLLGMCGIGYGETHFNVKPITTEGDDKHQRSLGLFQRSVSGDPSQAIRDDVKRLANNPAGKDLSIDQVNIDVTNPHVQALSYLGYLLEKQSNPKNLKIFEKIAQLPAMNLAESTRVVRDEIQFSDKQAKNGADAYHFLHAPLLNNVDVQPVTV